MYFQHLVTGDETWIYFYELETKENKAVQKHLKVLRNTKKILYVDFLSPKTTITETYYKLIIGRLRSAIMKKRIGRSKRHVLLLHDNTSNH